MRVSGRDPRQLGDHIQAIAVFEPHVDDRECGRLRADQVDALGDGMSAAHFEAAKLHSAREPLQERTIVIDDDEGAILGQFVLSK